MTWRQHDAVKRSNAQMEERKAPQWLQKGQEGQEPQTGRRHYA